MTSSSAATTSSSERRRSSCLSDVSVRSGSSKRSSTGDFSSELDDYFDNVAHRSLQSAVIEEEAAPELATSAPDGGTLPKPGAGGASAALARQYSLDHFVDNLINSAAQQSKSEIEQCATLEETRCACGSPSPLETYAARLASDIVRSVLDRGLVRDAVPAAKKSGEFMRPAGAAPPAPKQAGERRRRRIERQRTVSGFRDSVLSDFDKKLMSSHVVADSPSSVARLGSHRRRCSEPANLNFSYAASAAAAPTSKSASSDCRDVVSSWFAGQAPPSVPPALDDYVHGLVLDAFVESVSPSRSAPCRRLRHQCDQPHAEVPDAILLYAGELSCRVLHSVWAELAASDPSQSTGGDNHASLQSIADRFARSIVDDVLALQSSPQAAHLLVSSRRAV